MAARAGAGQKSQPNTRAGRAVKLCAAILLPLVLCFLSIQGWLDSWNGIVSDALYQRQSSHDGEILIIGIDQRALDEFGPMPWPRSIMAEAIANLNADPDLRPAVIGVDVLYAGESEDDEADLALAEAARAGGNVVTASLATYGSVLVEKDGEGQEDNFYIDNAAILAMDYPYPALREAVSTGHINAMADPDGILRHALLYVEQGVAEDADPGDPGNAAPFRGNTGGKAREYSFARTIYERWCAFQEKDPLPLPETTDGIYYIPYSASSGSFYEGVSLADLYYGDFDPGYYAGKIVLIGPYAAGLQDEYRSSLDHSNPMYGIECQANLIEAFRSGFAPREASSGAEYALLFLLCAFCVYIFYSKNLRSGALAWLGVSLGWIALCAIAYRQGIVLRAFYLPFYATLLFAGALVLHYVRSKLEEQRISRVFGRYVDASIIRMLMDIGGDELELGGKIYEIAALFVDIRGFTTMSESLDPPVVVDIINQYLSLTTSCIMRYHGTLDKFVGDCTMAFWNAPLPQEDPVYLACCAAMDMVEGSKALGEKLQQQFGRTVSFGVGVHAGPAVIGNIGSPMHMDYTAIGDTVNTASRLESNAPGGTIFISRDVANALGDRAKTTSLGNAIRLKGKRPDFEILTLDALEYGRREVHGKDKKERGKRRKAGQPQADLSPAEGERRMVYAYEELPPAVLQILEKARN